MKNKKEAITAKSITPSLPFLLLVIDIIPFAP